MKPLAAVAMCLALMGCASRREARGPESDACYRVHQTDESTYAVTCVVEGGSGPALLKQQVLSKADQLCPGAFEVTAMDVLENQHVHGTRLWQDVATAVVVCRRE